MKKILKYLKPYIGRMSFGLFIKIIGTVMDLAIPYILKYIVDDVIPTQDIKKIIIFGVIMVVCCIIGVTFSVWANRMASYVAMVSTKDIRHDLFDKIQSLSAKQMDEVTVPSLISRMTSDTYNVHQFIGMIQRIGVRAPILLIGGMTIIFITDPILALVLVATLPIVAILTYALTKKGLPFFTKVQISIDHLVRIVRENITGIRVIKALSKEDYERSRFEHVNKEVIDYELKSSYTMAKLSPIINLLLNIGLVLVIVIGAFKVNNGTSKVGEIISFTSYFTIILNAMISITKIFDRFTKASASATRIEYIFNIPVDLEKVDNHELSPYEIEFRDVCFEYHKHEDLEISDVKRYNVNNISFALKKGESLGIIGPTGSGKTTIINLLMRFYDVTTGSVFVGGRDVRTYDKKELHEKFGTALQNDTIFSDSVINNIDFYRNLSDEDLDKAIRTSQVHGFINGLDGAYDKELSAKGTNISGGQKQRIFIARALAGNPDILVLDDASSALDYKTDSILRNSIKENYPNITSVIIAQRISSIINCTYIMMIDKGVVLGLGTHEELMNTLPEYRSIYEAQMGDHHE